MRNIRENLSFFCTRSYGKIEITEPKDGRVHALSVVAATRTAVASASRVVAVVVNELGFFCNYFVFFCHVRINHNNKNKNTDERLIRLLSNVEREISRYSNLWDDEVWIPVLNYSIKSPTTNTVPKKAQKIIANPKRKLIEPAPGSAIWPLRQIFPLNQAKSFSTGIEFFSCETTPRSFPKRRRPPGLPEEYTSII